MDKAKTQEIITAMHGAMTSIGNASGRIGAAISHAEQVQTKMRAAGFHGVAQGMAAVIAALQQIQGQINAHSTAVSSAAGVVGEITDQTTPRDVKAKLSAAAGTLTSTGSGIVATFTSIAQAKQRVAAALQGGQPGQLINMIDTARQTLAQSKAQLGTAGQKISEADVEAQHAGN